MAVARRMSEALKHTPAAHTPGPWRWFTGQHQDGQQDRVKPSIKYLVGANGQGFAHTVGLDIKQDAANADLIAASPELLAFAEAVMRSGVLEPLRRRDLTDDELRDLQRLGTDALNHAQGDDL